MNPEKSCGYLLPTDSSPEAGNYTNEEYFCDFSLQNLIVRKMTGQTTDGEKIDCYLSPQDCPHRIDPISFFINQ